jgi:deferrochelatase/peroxidase EfeB
MLVGSPEETQAIVNRPRLLRRGAPYGDRLPEGAYDDDGRDRGLIFLCLNADIERQFEFVQQTWAGNPKFAGLFTDRDPIIGANIDPNDLMAPGPWTMTIPGVPIRRRLSRVPRFVTVKGGGYFFLPSIAALRFLGSMGV